MYMNSCKCNSQEVNFFGYVTVIILSFNNEFESGNLGEATWNSRKYQTNIYSTNS